MVADFYILSTCWELLWELNKMVFSIPGPAPQGLPPLPGSQGTAVAHQQSCSRYHCLLQLAPKSIVGHTDVMSLDVQLSYRPKTMRNHEENKLLINWLPNQHIPWVLTFLLSTDFSAETALGGWCADHMTTEIPCIKASIVYFPLPYRNPG